MERNLVYNSGTELVFLLDRSGSMAGLEADTIGGFNSMLRKQRMEPGRCLVSTVLFDHERLVLHDRVPLEYVRPLGPGDYTVRGSTALLDAIGGAIRHIGNVHRALRRKDVPAHTLFVITTDGMENASCRYSAKTVRAMIERQKERYGWEFLFIGANIDAIGTAERIGIRRDRAVNYNADAIGTHLVFEAVSAAVGNVRANQAPDENWSEAIREDHANRQTFRR